MPGSERTYGVPAEPIVAAGHVSRLAVIGDVHGNTSALAAVLDELCADPPDLVVVNGDLSWGPEPEETFALAETLPNALFLRGNAESALLRLAENGMETSDVGAWMLAQHTPDRLATIRGYAGAARVGVEGIGDVLVCHGSPRGDQEIVTPETPDPRMEALLGGIDLDVLVTGHVHLQFARTVCGITSVNAGSVGLPYGDEPAAYWAELGARGGDGGIAFRRTAYDVEEAVGRTVASGIPTAERYVSMLRTPPTREEIVEHGERLEASD